MLGESRDADVRRLQVERSTSHQHGVTRPHARRRAVTCGSALALASRDSRGRFDGAGSGPEIGFHASRGERGMSRFAVRFLQIALLTLLARSDVDFVYRAF